MVQINLTAHNARLKLCHASLYRGVLPSNRSLQTAASREWALYCGDGGLARVGAVLRRRVALQTAASREWALYCGVVSMISIPSREPYTWSS